MFFKEKKHYKEPYGKPPAIWLTLAILIFVGGIIVFLIMIVSPGLSEKPSEADSTYTLMRIGENGVIISALSPLTGEDELLARRIKAEASAASTGLPTYDTSSLDSCYLLRDVNNGADGVKTTDYYLFRLGEDCYIQANTTISDTLGSRRNFSEALYKEVVGIMGRLPTEDTSKFAEWVEARLSVIMLSPRTSSDSQDYIDAHPMQYGELMQSYPDETLQYLLSQFEAGNVSGLRGEIMMSVCKEILGARNNVTDKSLSPQEWYSRLSIIEETKLPDFQPKTPDSEYEALVYPVLTSYYSQPDEGFTVIAPTIYGAYEEEGTLKIMTIVHERRFKLYGKTLVQGSASIVPGALVFRQSERDGSWELEEYLEVGTQKFPDGSYFSDSIHRICVMPVSGKKIGGIAETMLEAYNNSDRTDRMDQVELLRKNLQEHLEAHGQTDWIIEGEIILY